jgi:heme exporter protein A
MGLPLHFRLFSQTDHALFGLIIYTLSKNKLKALGAAYSVGSWMKSNSLALEGLVVAREGAALTVPITIALAAGEMLAVRGDNGSGKSTLLKTIAGLLPVKAGAIKVNAQWPNEEPVLYIGHKLGLSKDMSVYDNVALWAKLSGAAELIAAALHYFDLGDIAEVPLSKLSAGWQQRVALTRLITVPSRLWLLDEPTANLDREGTALLQTLIQSRLEQGGIVLVATHAELQGNMIKSINISILN